MGAIGSSVGFMAGPILSHVILTLSSTYMEYKFNDQQHGYFHIGALDHWSITFVLDVLF